VLLKPTSFLCTHQPTFLADLGLFTTDSYIELCTTLYLFSTSILTDFGMDVNELEFGFPYYIDGITSSSIFEIHDEHEDRDSEQSQKLDPPQTQQQIITPNKFSEIYSLQRPIGGSLVHHALQIFLSDTVMPTPGSTTSKGHFANLISSVQSSTSGALPLALESVALASLANRLGNPAIQVEATRRYTTSIQRLRKVDLRVNSDVLNLISCIVLLGLYEVCTEQRITSTIYINADQSCCT
jgi:hypothetical protein